MMKNLYPTPHIDATPDDFASTVLMPGDPKRASFIAKEFLTETRLVNDVRGIKGYTGLYRNRRVSVMASGMGMPSMGIYSYELFTAFGVDNIIRIGTAGAISEDVCVDDIVLALGASTNSNYANQYDLGGTFSATASYKLLSAAQQAADAMDMSYHIGNILSSDTFYNDYENYATKWAKMGVLAVEMEAAALYMNAARTGKNALAICTVSDHIITGEGKTAEERQKSLGLMIELALNTAISFE